MNTIQSQSASSHRHGTHSTDDDPNPVLAWNERALDAITKSLDDNPPAASLLLAVQSIAVYDVVNAVRDEPGYLVSLDAPQGISLEAAIASASYQVLKYQFPEQRKWLRAELKESLASVRDGTAEDQGVAFGRAVADAVLAERGADLHRDEASAYFGVKEPGRWRATPPDRKPALEPDHEDARPFVLESADQVRPGPPPDLTSEAYAAAFRQVKALGERHSERRTEDQTEAARFWSNDAGTYTPVGHLNEIAGDIAADENTSIADSAHLFATLNVALADALIACWETKYHYNFWRPITAIRNADRDDNRATRDDDDWVSLLETPNHPEYASGHAVLAGTAEVVLQDFFGSTSFDARSAALPGVARHFDSFADMAEEDAMSRIYGGAHYSFSAEAGLTMGHEVGRLVMNSFDDWIV
jgi:PAP2 superfamily